MTNAHRYSFSENGFTIAREVIPADVVGAYRENWEAMSKARALRYNPVEVIGPFPEPLASLPHQTALLDVIEMIVGPDIALYNFRLVAKDAQAREPVFMHQDCGYHVGWPMKMSCFVAITKCGGENGGLVFYPGTHRTGYLGDTGSIKPDLLSHFKRTAYCPTLVPGDVAFMHSSLWHASLRNDNATDRVYADIIVQPSDDPSSKELLRGKWLCEPQPWLRSPDNFEWSRTSRLREMTERVEELRRSARDNAFERELSSRGDE